MIGFSTLRSCDDASGILAPASASLPRLAHLQLLIPYLQRLKLFLLLSFYFLAFNQNIRVFIRLMAVSVDVQLRVDADFFIGI